MLASFYRGGSRFFSRTDTVVTIISITGGGARSFSLLPFSQGRYQGRYLLPFNKGCCGFFCGFFLMWTLFPH